MNWSWCLLTMGNTFPAEGGRNEPWGCTWAEWCLGKATAKRQGPNLLLACLRNIGQSRGDEGWEEQRVCLEAITLWALSFLWVRWSDLHSRRIPLATALLGGHKGWQWKCGNVLGGLRWGWAWIGWRTDSDKRLIWVDSIPRTNPSRFIDGLHGNWEMNVAIKSDSWVMTEDSSGLRGDRHGWQGLWWRRCVQAGQRWWVNWRHCKHACLSLWREEPRLWWRPHWAPISGWFWSRSVF